MTFNAASVRIVTEQGRIELARRAREAEERRARLYPRMVALLKSDFLLKAEQLVVAEAGQGRTKAVLRERCRNHTFDPVVPAMGDVADRLIGLGFRCLLLDDVTGDETLTLELTICWDHVK